MRASSALLLGPALVSALVVQRDEWDTKFEQWKQGKPQELVEAFLNVKGKVPQGGDDRDEFSIFADYEKPNQYIKVILAPGDSYTAGIGSNGPGDYYKDSGMVKDNGCSRYRKGWPEQLRDLEGWNEAQGQGWRKDNFGACSGAVMSDILTKQLEQGENKDEDQYKKIGSYPNAPQIAVFTAGGNDMKFSDIVKTCIYNLPFQGDCETNIKNAEKRLHDDSERRKLIQDYHRLYASIIAAGRTALAAGGPAKPKNFQIFQGAYIPFFDEEDHVCDEISWAYLPTFWPTRLTTDFRKRLNNLTRDLNKVISDAVAEYKDYGVFFVDGYIKDFGGDGTRGSSHLFCAPTSGDKWDDVDMHSNQLQDLGKQYWFWSITSNWKDNDEGGDFLLQTQQQDWRPPNITQALLDHLKIDKEGADKLARGTPLNEIKPEINNLETFEKALSDLEVNDVEGKWTLKNDGWFRVFHPKGTAETVIANHFFNAIKDSRDWNFDKTTESPPKKRKSLQIFYAHLYDEGATGLSPKDTYMWQIYEGEEGVGVKPCEAKTVANADSDYTFKPDPAPNDSKPGILPNGIFKVKLGGQECFYVGDGKTEEPIGKLDCGGLSVECEKDYRFDEEYLDPPCAGDVKAWYRPVAHCEF